MKTKIFVALFSSLFLLVTAAPSALAYLRPTNQIIEILVRSQKAVSGFQVRQEIEFMDPQFPNGKISSKEILYLRRPLALRLESDNPKFKQVIVSRGGKLVVIVDGVITVDGNLLHGLVTDLFSASETSEILSRLTSAGVNTSVVSLGRDKEKVYFIIGAKENQPDLPQLWISKSDYVPFKLRVKERYQGKDQTVEIRFSGYGKAVAKWYPAAIDVFVDGAQIASVRSKEFRPQDRLPDDLFDLDKAKLSKTISKDVERQGPLSSVRFTRTLDLLRK